MDWARITTSSRLQSSLLVFRVTFVLFFSSLLFSFLMNMSCYVLFFSLRLSKMRKGRKKKKKKSCFGSHLVLVFTTKTWAVGSKLRLFFLTSLEKDKEIE